MSQVPEVRQHSGEVTHWIRLYEAQVGGSAGLNRKINNVALKTWKPFLQKQSYLLFTFVLGSKTVYHTGKKRRKMYIKQNNNY